MTKTSALDRLKQIRLQADINELQEGMIQMLVIETLLAYINNKEISEVVDNISF